MLGVNTQIMPRKMTSKQFREALAVLGLANQSDAARALGKGLRSVNGYCTGNIKIPDSVARHIDAELRAARSVPNNKHSHSSQ